MDKITSRRRLLTVAGLGGIAFGLSDRGAGLIGEARAQEHSPVAGPLAQASVAFGAWKGDQGLDRTSPAFDPITANHHTLAPFDVKIKAGGSVSYIVSGFHQILVYAAGTTPEDIDTSNLVLAQGPNAPPFPILIDDPAKRIYRGADPGGVGLDRTENVQFSQAGRYLVICGVIFHFVNDHMHGFVTVVP